MVELNKPTSELRKILLKKCYSGAFNSKTGFKTIKSKHIHGRLYFTIEEYVFGKDMIREKFTLICPYCHGYYTKYGYVNHVMSRHNVNLKKAREAYNSNLPERVPKDRKIIELNPRVFHVKAIRSVSYIAKNPQYPHEVEVIVEGADLLKELVDKCFYMQDLLEFIDTNPVNTNKFLEDFEKHLEDTVEDYLLKIEPKKNEVNENERNMGGV